MTITTHVCRGNFRSTWISAGGYEPVAERLLGSCNYDGYFLEYDTDRAGGFEPLRFLPKGNKIVVLGLVTSKSGTLEKKDDVKRRIDEATKFAPLEQFCLSPQCGFASTEEGNILAEEEQWAKLRMIVELADEVWGECSHGQAHQSRRSAPTTSAACCARRRSRRRAPSCEKGEISAAELQGDRGPRDREDHQEAGGDRAQARHRRRVPRSWWQFDFFKGLDGVELYS